MKVICLQSFRDKHTKEIHKKGDVFIVNKERFAEILTVGKFVEKYNEPAKVEADK